MTKSEFAEIVEWLHAQWPAAAAWGPATIDTTYHLLGQIDTSDVWVGVMALHELGGKWRPEPSEILKASREAAAERFRLRPQTKALPLETELMTLPAYFELRGFSTFKDAVLAWRVEHGFED